MSWVKSPQPGMIHIRLVCDKGVEHPTMFAATKCDEGDPRFACPANKDVALRSSNCELCG